MQLNATVTRCPTQNFDERFSTSPSRCIDEAALASRGNVILNSLLSEQARSLNSTSKSPPLTYPHLDCPLDQYQPYYSRSSTSNRSHSNPPSKTHCPVHLPHNLPHKSYPRARADKVLIGITPRYPPCPRTISTYAPALPPPRPRHYLLSHQTFAQNLPIVPRLQTFTTTVQAHITAHQRPC